MTGHTFDLRLFRYALIAAEHGSFRRAAAALNVQQSSVSKGVRSLEHHIGAALFERSHAGVRPTPAGERFLKEAAQGFDHLERAMQRIGAVQRGERGEVLVAASVPFHLLGDVFERFRQRHRGVSVELVEGTCNESVVSVQQRKADIAFVTKAPADSAVKVLHLRDEGMVAVLPKSHRLAKARATAPAELRTEEVILGAGGVGPEIADYLRRQLARSPGELNLQLHRVGLCDLINMVARGFGITIVPGRLSGIAPAGVVLVPLAGGIPMPVHAVWSGANPNPALKGLLGIARRTMPEHPRDGGSPPA